MAPISIDKAIHERVLEMTDRPWLATYRECGIPAQIDPNAHRSVVHMLEGAMKKYADKPAFRSFGQTLTYADVNRQSHNFASYLQAKLGVKKGDRIAVMMPNLLAFPIAFLGIIRAGAAQVNVNPLYTPRELRVSTQGRGRQGYGRIRRILRDGGRSHKLYSAGDGHHGRAR